MSSPCLSDITLSRVGTASPASGPTSPSVSTAVRARYGSLPPAASIRSGTAGTAFGPSWPKHAAADFFSKKSPECRAFTNEYTASESDGLALARSANDCICAFIRRRRANSMRGSKRMSTAPPTRAPTHRSPRPTHRHRDLSTVFILATAEVMLAKDSPQSGLRQVRQRHPRCLLLMMHILTQCSLSRFGQRGRTSFHRCSFDSRCVPFSAPVGECVRW